jgi:hypothetical protein
LLCCCTKEKKKKEEALLWRRITRRRIAGVYIYIYIFSYSYIFFLFFAGQPDALWRTDGGTPAHTQLAQHTAHIILYTSHIRSSSSYSLAGPKQHFFTLSRLASKRGGNITRTGPAKPTSRRIGLTARRKHIFLFFFFFLYIPLTLSAVCCVYYISYSIYRYIYIYSLLCLLYYSQQPGMPGRKKKEKLFFYTCRRDFDCPAPKKSQKIKVDPFILFCVLTK